MASGLASKAYRLIFRRTSTFTFAVVVAVLFFERGFNQVTDAFFDHHNEGKLWKHIKHKYEKPAEESS
uniref:Complex III subunit 9 n=1 Tax=Pogona vitticeps TaxID=103695 RepID=A0A6J0UBC0_9SAUR|nr:cytochrome b-c1 complex subunit 9 [Pogona vitticeps]